MVAVDVCRDDSCPEKFGESAFLDMRIKEAGLSVKEMLTGCQAKVEMSYFYQSRNVLFGQ